MKTIDIIFTKQDGKAKSKQPFSMQEIDPQLFGQAGLFENLPFPPRRRAGKESRYS